MGGLVDVYDVPGVRMRKSAVCWYRDKGKIEGQPEA
jgi:hypothetical protein